MSRRVLEVPSTKAYEEPVVRLDVDPVDGTVMARFSHTCTSCSGYGSPCRHCDNGRIVEKPAIDVLSNLLGPAGTRTLEEALTTVLEQLKGRR